MFIIIQILFISEQWKRQCEIRHALSTSSLHAGCLCFTILWNLCGENAFSNLIAIWPYLLLFLAACWLLQSVLSFISFWLPTFKIYTVLALFTVPILKESSLTLMWRMVLYSHASPGMCPPHSILNSCPLCSWDKIQNHWLRGDQGQLVRRMLKEQSITPNTKSSAYKWSNVLLKKMVYLKTTEIY